MHYVRVMYLCHSNMHYHNTITYIKDKYGCQYEMFMNCDNNFIGLCKNQI